MNDLLTSVFVRSTVILGCKFVIDHKYTDAKIIASKAFEKGLLLVPAGGNVIRIVPPLIISRREVNILIKKLNSIFEEI